MKIQLIFSPARLPSKYEALWESMWPPLSVLYLAAYVRAKIPDLEIRITDGCKIGYPQTLEEIRKFQPDLLGISFYTTTAHGAFQLAKDARAIAPHAKVVLGGPHATALPEETLRASGADLVVAGEGEEAFYQIVQGFREGKHPADLEKIPGVFLLKDGQVRRQDCPEFISSLDAIPSPAWDLVDLKDYRGWYLSKQNPEASMLFSRGCPYHCTFCSIGVWKTSGPILRVRSPENIALEMARLNRHFGIREIFDNSDEFNHNLPHAIQICEAIKKHCPGMTWKTQLRVTPVSEELVRAMAGAGCWYVHLGIESGNQSTLDGIEKHIRLTEVEKTCRLLKKYGIKILGLFMLYNVWEKDGKLFYEDAAATARTLDFAWNLIKNNLVDYLGWSVTTPYPGSKLYDIAVRHKLIREPFVRDWESWQKEGLFVMELPGIGRRDRARIKLKGEILRIRCLLKSGGFKGKDFSFLVKRFVHMIRCSFR